MSDNFIIRAEGLGKKYIIGHQSMERHTSLRDVISRSAGSFARTVKDMAQGKPIYAGNELEEFWALKNVSFDVKRGEVVGIVGKNGAGKSTLLKVLSRITEPTEGKVTIRGRVASLLEVGTGFHPELSGRENIYLNGAILGMTRAEIRRKFDEIVDFSGVEKFLDTPVKRYSSGMYVRLAFSVAAHLEPEILVVDEVLAVGDADFQQKCIGKMQDVSGDGRTVIFVSHNISSIRALCKTGLLLQGGQVSCSGDIETVLRHYLDKGQSGHSFLRASSTDKPAPPDCIMAARLVQNDVSVSECDSDRPFTLQLEVRITSDVNWSPELVIRNQAKEPVAFFAGALTDRQWLKKGSFSGQVSIPLDLKNFAAGSYHIDLILAEPRQRFIDYVESGIMFSLRRPPTPSGWTFRQERGQGFFNIDTRPLAK